MATYDKNKHSLFKKGLEDWNKFVSDYKGQYDFSKSVYAGKNNKVMYICPVHGEKWSDAKNMMRGALCQDCMFEARKGKTRITQSIMLKRFHDVHGDRFDYSQAKYVSQQTLIAIVCKRHGVFYQKPEYHWSGAKCPDCYHEDERGVKFKHTIETVANRLHEIYGDLFEILSKNYINSKEQIEVRCKKHNQVCFTTTNNLLSNNNPCSKCNHTRSDQEDAISNFLSIFVDVEQRNRTVLKPKELDIYLPNKKLAIEYCGMYWHSHGDVDSESKDKNKHFYKYAACRDLGIRLLTIYQSEWLERPKPIKRLLRNAIGKSKGKLMARKCELKKVLHQDSVDFYEKYHPQGGSGNGENYGLYWNGKLVACMRFNFGINDRGASKRTWTLSRYATRVNVSGGASKLFKAFIDEHAPREVKSFSDNRYFSGQMYAQLGFDLEEDSKPDYQVWSARLGIKSKSHYQRRSIQQRLVDHGFCETYDHRLDARTEREMTYIMGARRIYDCGKKRWIWKEQKTC